VLADIGTASLQLSAVEVMFCWRYLPTGVQLSYCSCDLPVGLLVFVMLLEKQEGSSW
jgi:hypothetical protein